MDTEQLAAESESTDDTSTDVEEGTEQGSGSTETEDNSAKAALSRENAKRRLQNKELAKQNEELAKKLKAFEDKDKSEFDKLSSKFDEVSQQNAQLTDLLQRKSLEVAFLADTTYDWHNPKLVLGQLNMADLVDSSGEVDVEKLKAETKSIADANPFLVKGDSTPATSGSAVGSKKKQDKSLSEKELRKRFPSL